MRRAAFFCALVMASAAAADEGMWTFNDFPSQKVQKAYGFSPSQAWLDHARLASARLARGCSGSFVSADGLVMTNHHCVHGCIQDLSTQDKNYVANGFYAATQGEELQCPNTEVNKLVEITDVTEAINKATQGLSDAKFNETLKAKMSELEKACATSDNVRCDVVTLYNGGKYNLYKYVRFQDVRLVWAPELAIAFFGGDPDNFNFPRYDLDAAFLRVYENDKPAKIDHHFKWSKAGAKEGDLTFVSGHPGRTSRLLTITELEYQRDVALPDRLLVLAQLRGFLTEFQRRGAEQKRFSESTLFSVENAFKALRGRHQALLDKDFFAKKIAEEKALRDAIAKDAAKAKQYGQAWAEIDRATEKLKAIREEYSFLEGGAAFQSNLFGIARRLVRLADELPKSNDKRLREYTDAGLPAVRQSLFSKAPIYPEFEEATLTFSLTKFREELGADHPLVKKVLGKESPESMAKRLVEGSKLDDVAVREGFFAKVEGKDAWSDAEALKKLKANVAASKDPMIVLARTLDADARALRKRYEDEVESVLKKNSELIAQARFEVLGTDTYPDATFTLRLSYGAVKGWMEKGKKVDPITRISGAFDRHTGQEPFALPKSWLDAKAKLDGKVPFNFVTTNDIIGGNSGSPAFNKEGEIVGLVFDGNIHSLGGEYGYDGTMNRTVAVHSAGIIESLKKVYKAERLLKELQGTQSGATGSSR